MRLLLSVMAILLAAPAWAAPILYTPVGASFSMKARNVHTAAVNLCFIRVDVTPAVELACALNVAPGATVTQTVDVPYTPGQDAEIRVRSCLPPAGTHPQATCSGYSTDHAPVRMTAPGVPELRQ